MPSTAGPSSAHSCQNRPPDACLLVLDTNVVLDWMIFRDAACAALVAAIESHRVSWIATSPMRQELEHVLTRSPFAERDGEAQSVLVTWDRWAKPTPEPAPRGASSPLRCTDPDDQKFIDLAVSARARWLVTRDRALLKLARRSHLLGVEVIRPDAWAAAADQASSRRLSTAAG